MLSGQHYYWDWSSDLVSWLPPGHPKCQISQPASQLREELHLKDGDQDDNSASEESGSDQEMEVSLLKLYIQLYLLINFANNLEKSITVFSDFKKKIPTQFEKFPYIVTFILGIVHVLSHAILITFEPPISL